MQHGLESIQDYAGARYWYLFLVKLIQLWLFHEICIITGQIFYELGNGSSEKIMVLSKFAWFKLNDRFTRCELGLFSSRCCFWMLLTGSATTKPEVETYRYERMYVSSYRIFDGIVFRSMDKETVGYRSEWEDVSKELKIFWIVFHKYDIHKPKNKFINDFCQSCQKI